MYSTAVPTSMLFLGRSALKAACSWFSRRMAARNALVHPARPDVEREFSPSTLDPPPVDRHDRVIGLHKGGHDGGNSGVVEAEPTDLRFKRGEPRLAVPDLLRHALRAWLGRVDAAALATHEACRSDRRAANAVQ